MSNLSSVMSREERRKENELREARQAGSAPAEVDAATGKIINPHLPVWMAKPAWYQDTGGGPSLEHQKKASIYDPSPAKLEKYVKKAIIGKATKFRKGACENCGAVTHQRKDCLERPRKIGAAFSGTNIAADEILVDGKGEAWDEKRDRWAGYDPASHKRLILEHDALEAARQKLREEELDRGITNDLKSVKTLAKAGKKKKQQDDDDFGSSDESDEDDETKYADGADAAGQKLDTKNRVTVRNLRIREDTAKYLQNLDTDSAYYDPKTRSMREAPALGEDGEPGDEHDPGEEYKFVGDNFARSSGEATNMQKLQLFAWQAEERGSNVHVNANPTQAALVHKQFLEKKGKLKDTSSKSILDKYGGEKYLKKPDRELIEGQSENYVEYDRSTGALVKGLERAKAVSKYAEDVLLGNHTSVWGSWWADSVWGFACCHSTMKNSYCVGEVGRRAAEQSTRLLLEDNDDESRKRKAEGDAEELRPRKVQTTLKSGMKPGSYNQVTDEELERFQQERKQFEDPLRGLGKNELLPL